MQLQTNNNSAATPIRPAVPDDDSVEMGPHPLPADTADTGLDRNDDDGACTVPSISEEDEHASSEVPADGDGSNETRFVVVENAIRDDTSSSSSSSSDDGSSAGSDHGEPAKDDGETGSSLRRVLRLGTRPSGGPVNFELDDGRVISLTSREAFAPLRDVKETIRLKTGSLCRQKLPASVARVRSRGRWEETSLVPKEPPIGQTTTPSAGKASVRHRIRKGPFDRRTLLNALKRLSTAALDVSNVVASLCDDVFPETTTTTPLPIDA
jgi:hypothetical protein